MILTKSVVRNHLILTGKTALDLLIEKDFCVDGFEIKDIELGTLMINCDYEDDAIYVLYRAKAYDGDGKEADYYYNFMYINGIWVNRAISNYFNFSTLSTEDQRTLINWVE